MSAVDFSASLPHYLDHLAPIWDALPADRRGRFFTSPHVARRARSLGIAPTVATPRGPARLTVVAAYADLAAARRRPIVLVNHGTGQTYSGAHESYAGGARRDRVVLFLEPNPAAADADARAWPDAEVAVVGCPRLDRWHRASAQGRKLPTGGPTVAVTFHWDCRVAPESRSAWPHYDAGLDLLAAEAGARGWRLLGHGHPRLWPQLRRRWEALGVDRTGELGDVFDQADVLVADNTSAMWEFASLDRPLVVLDAPWYRRDVHHGLRFWTHADAGVRITEPDQLADAVAAALDDPPLIAGYRRAAADDLYPLRDGHAAARAAATICDLADRFDVDEWTRRTRMGNPYAARPRQHLAPLLGVVDTPRNGTVPDNAADVVAWIDDDPERAQVAWQAELARDGTPRKTVEAKVRSLLGGETAGG